MNTSTVLTGKVVFFVVAIFLTLFMLTPQKTSAAAVSISTATSTSNNASTTLAKVGDTITFGLRLSGTPAATSSPVIRLLTPGFTMASTSMSGSGTTWFFSTTSATLWSSGNITFNMGWGGTAGEATTTFMSSASTTFRHVSFDKTSPTAFSTGAASSTGGTATAGFWNDTNTGANVVVPVENDATLVGGTIQVQARVDSGSYENIGSAHTIVSGNLGGNVTISLTANNIESITGYTEGGVITFQAIITDAPGNQTTGSASADSLTIDTAVGTPTANVSAGSYSSAITVELSSTGSNSIRYTIDGTTPTCSTGTVFSSAITISPGSVTLQAIGCDTGGNSSGVFSATYNIHTVGGGGGGGSPAIVTLPPTQTLPQAVPTTVPGSDVSSLISQLRSLIELFKSLGGTPTPQMTALAGDVPGAVTSSFARDLGYGATGDDVRGLQVFLNTHGYSVATSGPGSAGSETNVFGPGTKAALIKFQQANGIVPASGYFGPKTRAAVSSQ